MSVVSTILLLYVQEREAQPRPLPFYTQPSRLSAPGDSRICYLATSVLFRHSHPNGADNSFTVVAMFT